MSSKSNIEYARLQITYFWWFFGAIFVLLVAFEFSDRTKGNPASYLPLIFMAGMGGCAFRATRAFKREITDLRSGEVDSTVVAEDTTASSEDSSPVSDGE